MVKFAKTNDGKIHVVVSDNTTDKTILLLNYYLKDSCFGKYGELKTSPVLYTYSEILVIDTNLIVVKNFKIGE